MSWLAITEPEHCVLYAAEVVENVNNVQWAWLSLYTFYFQFSMILECWGMNLLWGQRNGPYENFLLDPCEDHMRIFC